MDYATLLDKCRGSLVGGAVGDALGYEVEFMPLSAIRKRFGRRGITRYVLHGGVAPFSDDTQMTLFTLEGLMNGVAATCAGKKDDVMPYIEKAYINWFRTQAGLPATLTDSRLGHIDALWVRRAPGLTCLGALENIVHGFSVDNNSKGCGGVMRVAPIGIFSAAHPDIYSEDDAALLAGRAAEITHKHIASTFASALLATTVRACILEEAVSQQKFTMAVEAGVGCLDKYYPDHDEELRKFSALIDRALKLGQSDVPEEEAIRQLGEGWVGDEAIAIAIFAVVRHIDSFEDCVVCAVNHNGDSDSTGAIAGNLIGAILGYSAIPAHYLDTLELRQLLVDAADSLCSDISL